VRKIIAICVDIPDLNQNRWMSEDHCKLFPGSRWIPALSRIAQEQGHIVVSGDIAVRLVSEQLIKPGLVHVIQEQDASDGKRLMDLGCHPFLLMCHESPLYAPRFYDALPDLRARFPHQMLFEKGNLYFPSFAADELLPPKPWEGRKPMCLVMANKHYSWLEELFGDSPSWREAIQSQIQDARYSAIGYFKAQGMLDLFGKGWHPSDGKPVDDKTALMRDYKFAIAFENGAYPGYVTEKIIDAIVAGCIPVYLGAPDIAHYVPEACFIQAYGKTWPVLESELTEMPESQAEAIIQAGQDFLRSPAGLRFTYQGMAERVLGALDSSI
jgi:hypothetical protein